MNTYRYDVIVVGAGHAGCEAACAAANIGVRVLLLTFDMEKIAQMSCNPAIGGIAKGQIVREIDALGGYTGIVTDKTSIQFRMLNLSKGPAMWSPRAQCDRLKFSTVWREIIERTQNIDIWQDEVVSVIIENGNACGVVTRTGVRFLSNSVVLTNGTFLNGQMYVGRIQTEGGRIAEPASKGLSESLRNAGFETARMRTDTPPRIDGRTVNFSKLERQDGDAVRRNFSFLNTTQNALNQRPCYIAWTNSKVHRILERGFVDSPMFNGTLESKAPRYCPSIEQKIVTFAAKDTHHLFLEPEGTDTEEYYLNGFSTSLPWETQWEALRQIDGFEDVKIFRPGYAIEYDYFPPTQLWHSLETKLVSNLYFAGQINGTTGYEEAAAQGLMAGINAALKAVQKQQLVLLRDQAYIGVLIDDLVTKGVDEPYRMFTSRAEYRILLRQDNADVRLTQLSYDIGLASKERLNILNKKIETCNKLTSFLQTQSVSPSDINNFLEKSETAPIKQSIKMIDLVTRPQVSLHKLIAQFPNIAQDMQDIDFETIEATEISIKYAGYIERERLNADKLRRLEHIGIPVNFDFRKLNSLSMEARIKLSQIRPQTIGQASRISGVSPSDINVLLINFGR
jgi:tRNA uridine 5-carboxymethylaminomethyl modification enzyme